MAGDQNTVLLAMVASRVTREGLVYVDDAIGEHLVGVLRQYSASLRLLSQGASRQAKHLGLADDLWIGTIACIDGALTQRCVVARTKKRCREGLVALWFEVKTSPHGGETPPTEKATEKLRGLRRFRKGQRGRAMSFYDMQALRMEAFVNGRTSAKPLPDRWRASPTEVTRG